MKLCYPLHFVELPIVKAKVVVPLPQNL